MEAIAEEADADVPFNEEMMAVNLGRDQKKWWQLMTFHPTDDVGLTQPFNDQPNLPID